MRSRGLVSVVLAVKARSAGRCPAVQLSDTWWWRRARGVPAARPSPPRARPRARHDRKSFAIHRSMDRPSAHARGNYAHACTATRTVLSAHHQADEPDRRRRRWLASSLAPPARRTAPAHDLMERLEGTCGRQVGGQRNLMMTTFSPASDRSSCCPPIPPHQKQQCELAVTGASSSACVSNYLHPGGRDDTHASPPPSYLSPIDCTCTAPGPAPARMHACRLFLPGPLPPHAAMSRLPSP